MVQKVIRQELDHDIEHLTMTQVSEAWRNFLSSCLINCIQDTVCKKRPFESQLGRRDLDRTRLVGSRAIFSDVLASH